MSIAERVETELVSNFSSVHCVGQILLVGKDEQQGVPQFIFVQHALQLVACLRDTVTIVRVDNKNDTLGVLEVYVGIRGVRKDNILCILERSQRKKLTVSPKRTDFVLTSNVPHSEGNVLVLDSLHVETLQTNTRVSQSLRDNANRH